MKILKVNLSRDDDPTGQARNRADLNKKLQVRLANAESEVKKLFRVIPRTSKVEKNLSLNQDTFTTYEYDLPPEQQDALESAIEAIILLWLLQGRNQNKPANYYSDVNVDVAYRAGTLETVQETNSALGKIAIAGALLASMPRSIDTSIVFTQAYLNNVLGYQNDMFYDIKGLSSKTSAQVYERIMAGVKAGKTPREIIKDITKRFDVAKSSAERIVQTQINKTYNDSITDTIDYINENTSLNAAGIHKSALLPNRTRAWHAARHNKMYTTAQQNSWWSEGANRINCYCSFVIVLLDKDNKPILE